MEYTIKKEGKNHLITLRGRFTFSDHGNFKKMVDSLVSEKVMVCILNFTEVDFIDSSGLGMLLILREALEAFEGKITLLHPQGQVEKMLRISQFDQMFSIKAA